MVSLTYGGSISQGEAYFSLVVQSDPSPYIEQVRNGLKHRISYGINKEI